MKFTGAELISHNDKLMAYAYKRTKNRDDALELVQTTYMKAIRYNSSFYRKDNPNLGAWLMTILKNALKDYYEKNSHYPMDDTPYEDLNELELPPHFDEYQLGKVFKDDRIEKAMSNLTTLQKEAIYQTYVLDANDAEISRELGIPKRTWISRRKKAMDRIRKTIEE